MQILHTLTLNYMTLTLTQGHMISTMYCPLPWPVILKKNKVDIYPYTWTMGRNVKTNILMTFDLENAPIDPKINRLRPWPIPYYSTKYHAPMSFHVEKKWETDRQTDTQTDGQDQKLYSCPIRWGNYKNNMHHQHLLYYCQTVGWQQPLKDCYNSQVY